MYPSLSIPEAQTPTVCSLGQLFGIQRRMDALVQRALPSAYEQINNTARAKRQSGGESSGRAVSIEEAMKLMPADLLPATSTPRADQLDELNKPQRTLMQVTVISALLHPTPSRPPKPTRLLLDQAPPP